MLRSAIIRLECRTKPIRTDPGHRVVQFCERNSVNAASPLYLANVTAARNTAHGNFAKQKLAIDSIWYQRLFP
jgi:hypothetical protein